MNFLFIGHRGTRTDFDENTINAFRTAIESGANFIEFDLRKTSDNELIVFHDRVLDRMTNNSGKIENYSLIEIKKIKTINKKENIPVFNEVLIKFKDRVNFMVELKLKGIWRDVLKSIKKKNLINQCVISSRDYILLQKIKKQCGKIKTCYNITKGQGLTLDEFLKKSKDTKKISSLDMISLRSSLITHKFIEYCHFQGIFALAWDFINYSNPILKIKNLILIGIDGILFDNYKNIPLVKEWMKKNIK